MIFAVSVVIALSGSPLPMQVALCTTYFSSSLTQLFFVILVFYSSITLSIISIIVSFVFIPFSHGVLYVFLVIRQQTDRTDLRTRDLPATHITHMLLNFLYTL